MAAHELEPQSFTVGGVGAWTFDALPALGVRAPDFHLADATFRDYGLKDFLGKVKVLNLAPSLEGAVSRKAAERFREMVKGREDTVLLNVTMDLPLAQARFCLGLGGGENVRFLSCFRAPEFGMDYGALIVEHALMGLLARAVVIIDAGDVVRFRLLARELKEEPDYGAVRVALEGIWG